MTAPERNISHSSFPTCLASTKTVMKLGVHLLRMPLERQDLVEQPSKRRQLTTRKSPAAGLSETQLATATLMANGKSGIRLCISFRLSQMSVNPS